MIATNFEKMAICVILVSWEHGKQKQAYHALWVQVFVVVSHNIRM